jgi:hypothetical protein
MAEGNLKRCTAGREHKRTTAAEQVRHKCCQVTVDNSLCGWFTDLVFVVDSPRRSLCLPTVPDMWLSWRGDESAFRRCRCYQGCKSCYPKDEACRYVSSQMTGLDRKAASHRQSTTDCPLIFLLRVNEQTLGEVVCTESTGTRQATSRTIENASMLHQLAPSLHLPPNPNGRAGAHL